MSVKMNRRRVGDVEVIDVKSRRGIKSWEDVEAIFKAATNEVPLILLNLLLGKMI